MRGEAGSLLPDQPGGTHFPKCVPPKRRFLFPAVLVLCLLAPLSLPGEPSAPAFSLVFVGDVMLGRGVAQALDGDWEAAFADVRPWLAGTEGSAEAGRILTMANLESPLTDAPRVGDGYDLRAPPEAVAALLAAGFDLVSLANNHALDAGQAGLQDTVSALRAVGITALTDGSTPLQFPGPHSKNLHFLAFDDSVNPLNVSSAVEAVAAAAERADVVVVSVHWGGEYQAAPGPRQRALARRLSSAGADLIVGHGPHVLQRVEWMGETLVAYSLGNFLFDQPYPVDCRWGAILRVTFQEDPIVGRTNGRTFNVRTVEALPTVVARGRVTPAGPEDAAAILARLALADIQGPGGVAGAEIGIPHTSHCTGETP